MKFYRTYDKEDDEEVITELGFCDKERWRELEHDNKLD
jgi:hypothetical protein